MSRSIVENADLPYAVHWERLREGYYRQQHQHEMADHCAELANWHQARLDHYLEDQINV